MVYDSTKRLTKIGRIKLRHEESELQRVPTYKYLGMTLESTLSLKQLLSYVVRTFFDKIYILTRVMKYLSYRTALLVYKSMILPYRDYADIVHNKACAHDLGGFQKLQTGQLSCV